MHKPSESLVNAAKSLIAKSEAKPPVDTSTDQRLFIQSAKAEGFDGPDAVALARTVVAPQ